MARMNRKYKDSVFTDLFGSDRDGKRNFLELYNALSGKNLKYEETVIERKVIEQTLYKTYNNDVSMLINGELIVLVEHQSTINENMPFRCLEYITRIYESIMPPDSRYSKKIKKLPNPDFYVIYVGKDIYPDEKVLKLSDAFYNSGCSNLELKVNVKNCSSYSSYYRDLKINSSCDILRQYCRFVEIIEEHLKVKRCKRQFKIAVQKSIEEGILSEYLQRKSTEVVNMLCAKYDYKADRRAHYQDGFEDGALLKAIAASVILIKDFNIDPETAAEKMNAPLEKVLEELEK